MSEIMDDYDSGYDLGYNEGLLSGKKFHQGKIIELMEKLIKQYESMSVELKFPAPPIYAHAAMVKKKEYQINTAKYILEEIKCTTTE
jgi:hypothetical protein